MLDLVIQQSESVKDGDQNGSTNFVAKGDLVNTLKALEFEPHIYFDHQTGRNVLDLRFWHKIDDDQQNGTMVFIGKIYWWAVSLVSGEYICV